MKLKTLGIICAESQEAEPYRQATHIGDQTTIAKMHFTIGELFGKKAVVVQCGNAKVNAALATQILKDIFDTDFVVLSGTAGALDKNLKIGDVVVATGVACHDLEPRIITDFIPYAPDGRFPADDNFLQAAAKLKETSRQNIILGEMASGDTFISGEQRDAIAVRLRAVAVDMESAAVGHACFANDLPFAVVKAITDTVEHDSFGNFGRNMIQASKNAFNVTEGILTK